MKLQQITMSIVEMKKGRYGLKQATRHVYNDLVLHLQKHGYYSDKICQNIWSHKMRIFFLSVQR